MTGSRREYALFRIPFQTEPAPMAITRQPTNFRIRVSGDCPTHACTEVRARQHRLVIDEPPVRGGTDLGPTPLETLLSSFLGCTNVIAHRIAEEMDIVLRDFSVSLVATLDTDGINGVRDTLVPFPEIKLTVTASTTSTEKEMALLRERLARRCPVSVILRQAGARIEENWRIIRP